MVITTNTGIYITDKIEIVMSNHTDTFLIKFIDSDGDTERIPIDDVESITN